MQHIIYQPIEPSVEKQERFRLLVEGMPVGVVPLDRAATIVLAIRAARTLLLGHRATEARLTPRHPSWLHGVVPWDSFETHAAYIHADARAGGDASAARPPQAGGRRS